ncbi:hypothetical protein OIU83_18950 [Flavobacterium sp. LS1R49]|uniref:Uncharacterized protein n=1 Tax=Flavobacterium shii TaxID=2987687 RepID=A0A9X2ZJB0_9FLAO|nr:hypothetical protein [Flavobacterium shii]MCV9929747.1 hypothetical protein [Flavobacterium shii]
MLNALKKNNEISPEDSLVDERGNKGIIFILFLAILGIGVMILYSCEGGTFISVITTLFFVSGGIFTFSSLIGFLFGIPRTMVIDESEKSKSRYMGNDNLLQVSDWLTKIILGLGLTQIHQIPSMLKRIAKFIKDNTEVSNQALIILILIYFACLGFLFGYLWTRLYFIKMLRDSDNDVNNDEEVMTEVTTKITTDITTGVSTGEDKK